MGRKNLSQFDSEKDEWYYQPRLYLNKKDDNTSLYDELKEFRLSLSEDVENDAITENLSVPLEDENEDRLWKTSRTPYEKNAKDNGSQSQTIQTTGPFFDGKLELLKDEIEDINRNIQIRVKISKCLAQCIEAEKKILRQKLHDLYTWTSGDKATVESVRMELTRQLCALNREKRANKLNLWKDKVFEKRDRRQLLFEYKALAWANDFTVKTDKEKSK